MLHVSTAQNYGVKEEISPRGIARGQGDAYLLRSTRASPRPASPSTCG